MRIAATRSMNGAMQLSRGFSVAAGNPAGIAIDQLDDLQTFNRVWPWLPEQRLAIGNVFC